MQSPPRYDLGGCRVTVLDGGHFKLDGGAMFGIIPKPLWTRSTPADEQNRIDLACNCLLVEWAGGARRLVIEAGLGAKYGDKEQRIFALDPTRWLLPSLRAAGVEAGQITDIALTHLHFDHAGGVTEIVDGQARLTFSRAQVHVQRQEYEDARAGFGLMTATYRAENLSPVDASARWNLVEGEAELLPGVRAVPAPGHTRGHQAIRVAGRSRALVFAGDVMPTAAHLGPPYNMGYDLFPLENRASKQRLLSSLAGRDDLLVIGHEPRAPVVHVRTAGEWFELTPAEPDDA